MRKARAKYKEILNVSEQAKSMKEIKPNKWDKKNYKENKMTTTESIISKNWKWKPNNSNDIKHQQLLKSSAL